MEFISSVPGGALGEIKIGNLQPGNFKVRKKNKNNNACGHRGLI